MADTTHEALRAHLEKWSAKGKPGFNSSPLGKHEEAIRWLCARLDAMSTWAYADGGPLCERIPKGARRVRA